jgi:hypothetical protein
MKSINSNQTQLKTLFFGLLCLLAGVVCFAKGFSHNSANHPEAVSAIPDERQGVSLPCPFIRDAGKPQFTSLTPRYITKRIADLEVGEEVVAKDPESGEVTTKRVANVFRKVSDHLRILQVRNPLTNELQTIETTDDHPFWVSSLGRWIDAKDLKLGDRLDDVDGGTAILESTSRELHPEGIPVFNFEVEDFHTYFVRAHGSRGPPVLTHNTECGFVSLAAVEQAAQDASARYSLATRFIEENSTLIAFGKKNGLSPEQARDVFSAAEELTGGVVTGVHKGSGRHFALGIRELRGGRLRGFANDVNAEHLLNSHKDRWKAEFLELVENPSVRFSVDLEGFKPRTSRSVEEIIRFEMQNGGNTAWELKNLRDAGRLGEVDFWMFDSPVANPFR